MYAENTSLSLLKLKSEFQNSKLESIKKDPDETISNFGGLRIQMSNFDLKDKITGEDFMMHILNNLNGLENHLTASGDNPLTIEVIHKKLNQWHEKKAKMKKREKRKGLRSLQ